MSEAGPTIRLFPLERRKIIKKTIAGSIFWVLLLAIAAIILPFMSGFEQAGIITAIACLLFIVVIILILFWYQTLYFEKYYYDIREDFLVIKKGVFAPRETVLPYEKIQDVYIDQDIFDRIFNLWDLHVSTATYLSGQEAHIDGVSLENGEAMKKMILEKIKTSKK
ncbi:MAG: PH domain-containing protein [Candidatus Diapherotrites archaeon]